MSDDEDIKTTEEGIETEEVELVPDLEDGGQQLQEKMKKFRENLNKCEIERKEYLEGWQRAKADYINYKNEESKRFEDLSRFVTASLLMELLPVLDSFDLALAHGLPQELERGVVLIRSQLENVLRKKGAEVVQVKPGEDFSPERHESIGEIESDFEVGKLVEEIQKGYTFHGRVLRPARVKISKGPSSHSFS